MSLWIGMVLSLVGTAPAAPADAAVHRPLVVNGHTLPEAAPLNRAPVAGELLLLRDSSGNMSRSRAEVAAESGFTIHGFLHPDTYLVSLRGAGDEAARADQQARAAGFVARSNGRFFLRTFEDDWKIDTAFDVAIAEASLRQSTNEPPRDYPVVVLGVSDMTALEETFRDLDLAASSRPQTPGKVRLGLLVPETDLSTLLPRLAARPEVLAVEPGGVATLLNNHANKIVQFGAPRGFVTALPIWDRGIRGEGVTVAILDTGLDCNHVYFGEADGSVPPLNNGSAVGTPDTSRRKIVAYDFIYSEDFAALPGSDFDNQGHGTYVAGNAVGNRLDFPFAISLNNGIAPAAQLVVQDGGFNGFDNCADLAGLGCPVIDLTPFLEQAHAQGARLHNNSWGDRENFSPQNTYTAACVDVDDMMWRFPDFLIVCAAGNAGPGAASVASPSVAKNALSVGATGSPTGGGIPNGPNDFNALAGFSSRGPSDSPGQIKPDITAPGITMTALTDGDGSTTDSSVGLVQGTSMASPVTMGSAALAYNYLQSGFYPGGVVNGENAIEPSAALVKAMLLAGAADMANVSAPAPNMAEGWGRVDLDRALPFFGNEDGVSLILFDSRDYFTTPATEPYTIDIGLIPVDAAYTTRMMITYTEPPASELAESFMVNDLNLKVTDLDTGVEYYGNDFDELTGLSNASGAPEDANTVEGVQLRNPQTTSRGGTGEMRRLRIEVSASRIVEGPQGFALAVNGPVVELGKVAATGVVTR